MPSCQSSLYRAGSDRARELTLEIGAVLGIVHWTYIARRSLRDRFHVDLTDGAAIQRGFRGHTASRRSLDTANAHSGVGNTALLYAPSHRSSCHSETSGDARNL